LYEFHLLPNFASPFASSRHSKQSQKQMKFSGRAIFAFLLQSFASQICFTVFERLDECAIPKPDDH
jgi:hypothetical protein